MINKIFDTIVAIATPKGKGAIGIIRLSGNKSYLIAKIISKKKLLLHNKYNISKFYINDFLLDVGLILYFKKPKSFTGEDVVEFHTHGSILILDTLLFKIVDLGARLAEPGEFSFRAYFNGKIDLLQASSINNLINSKIISSNLPILKSMTGKFSRDLKYLFNNILLLRRDIEAFIEFPDSVFFNKDYFFKNFLAIKEDFLNLYKKISFINLNSDNFRIVIIGDTNVGKSSLFNFLLNEKRSIISSIPGTTRDFVESLYNVNDIYSFSLVDTAGFNFNSKSFLEKKSLFKTFEQINKACLILFVFDISRNVDMNSDYIFNLVFKKFYNKKKFFVVFNKIDLLNEKKYFNKDFYFYISLKNKTGLDFLVNAINSEFVISNESLYLMNKIFFDLLTKIKNKFFEAEKFIIDFNSDLFSDMLKSIYEDFSCIFGKNLNYDILCKIFSDFCLGK